MTPLTKRQKDVLDAIATWDKAHGFAPTFKELGDALGLSSGATVHKHIVRLMELGYVTRAKGGGYRDIQLIPKPVRGLKSCNAGHAICWFQGGCPACAKGAA